MRAQILFQHWGTDYSLTARQSADMLAFSALMEEKLMPALVSISFQRVIVVNCESAQANMECKLGGFVA